MSLSTSVIALSLLMGAPAEAPPTRPATNVEPRPKAEEQTKGAFMIGLGLGGRARWSAGGEWTRARPFHVQVPLGAFVVARFVFYSPPTLSEWFD